MGWGGEGADKRCCYRCKANMTTLPAGDVLEWALWRSTIITHAIFMSDAMLAGGYISKLYDLPGFVYGMISIDLMHCGSLGVNLYLLGCILWELVRDELQGLITKPDEQLQFLLILIQQASRALKFAKPAINKLTLGMIRGKGAPQLKVKASESNHLLQCVEYILRHHFPLDTDKRRMRYQCVCHFNAMYACIKDWAGPKDGDRAASHARKGLLLMAELQHIDREELNHQHRGFSLYKFYQKMHLLVHCMEEQSANGNAKTVWCFADESEIGAAIIVAESLHKSTLHRAIIRKHRVMIA